MRLYEKAIALVATVVPWSLAYQLVFGQEWAFSCGVGAFASYRLIVDVVTDWRDPERDQ